MNDDMTTVEGHVRVESGRVEVTDLIVTGLGCTAVAGPAGQFFGGMEIRNGFVVSPELAGAGVWRVYRPLERKNEPAPESPVDEARRLVLGDRNDAYGNPADDYAATAKVWSGLLSAKLKCDISAKEAILMMVALKLRREVHRPKRDNIVDAHGYLLCAEWAETGVKPR